MTPCLTKSVLDEKERDQYSSDHFLLGWNFWHMKSPSKACWDETRHEKCPFGKSKSIFVNFSRNVTRLLRWESVMTFFFFANLPPTSQLSKFFLWRGCATRRIKIFSPASRANVQFSPMDWEGGYDIILCEANQWPTPCDTCADDDSVPIDPFHHVGEIRNVLMYIRVPKSKSGSGYARWSVFL